MFAFCISRQLFAYLFAKNKRAVCKSEQKSYIIILPSDEKLRYLVECVYIFNIEYISGVPAILEVVSVVEDE